MTEQEQDISKRLIAAVDALDKAVGNLVTVVLEATTAMSASAVLVVAAQATIAHATSERNTERGAELATLVRDHEERLRRLEAAGEP